jgi:hypothetical protein
MKTRKPLESLILTIRGSKVLLDLDLAEIYGVRTKRLNEQVKRNVDRFPSDFIFQLNAKEKKEVVANCDHLALRLKRLAEIDRALLQHDAALRRIWEKLQPLLAPPPEPPRRRIKGFDPKDES